MWCVVVFLVTLAGTSAFADDSLTFPEIARGNARIVSGWEATEGQLPHQLSIRMINPSGQVSSCGASIIHNQWALTAAHCTAGRHNFVIRAGTVNLTRPYYIFESMEFYNHPLYNNNLPSVVQPNDVGVLKFDRWLEFNELVQPIRIQRSVDKDNNYDGARMTASGWGRVWTNGYFDGDIERSSPAQPKAAYVITAVAINSPLPPFIKSPIEFQAKLTKAMQSEQFGNIL